MAIPAGPLPGNTAGMAKATTPAVSPVSRRGSVTRISRARQATPRRDAALSRARAARNGLRPRSERFAHLKRMHD